MGVEDDAERLLFLIPFVASHEGGVALATLREMLGVDEKRLIALLEAGSMVGAPGGAPDEYVGLVLEDDRVHVFLPQRFDRPVRFTVREAWALMLALAPLVSSPLPGLRERARALRSRLLDLSSGRAASVRALAPPAPPAGDEGEGPLRALERAVLERRAVSIEYWSKSRDSVGEREIEPILLLSENGAWYVGARDGKTYRVDRVRRATLLERTFDAPRDEVEALREQAFSSGADERAFVVLEDGTRRTLKGEVNASVHAYLREGRGRRVLVEPREAREAFLSEVRSLLARYEPTR